MTNDDGELKELWRSYRESCPEVEPGINFMPQLWQKIDARRNFWWTFGHLGRTFTTASAALFVLLLLLNLTISGSAHVTGPTYADALMSEHSAEQTYYAEAIRSTPAPNPASSNSRQP